MLTAYLCAELQVAFFGNICRRAVLEAIEEGTVVVELVNTSQLETYVFPAFGESDLSEMVIEADAVRPFSFLIDVKIVVSITITGGKVPFPA